MEPLIDPWYFFGAMLILMAVIRSLPVRDPPGYNSPPVGPRPDPPPPPPPIPKGD